MGATKRRKVQGMHGRPATGKGARGGFGAYGGHGARTGLSKAEQAAQKVANKKMKRHEAAAAKQLAALAGL